MVKFRQIINFVGLYDLKLEWGFQLVKYSRFKYALSVGPKSFYVLGNLNIIVVCYYKMGEMHVIKEVSVACSII